MVLESTMICLDNSDWMRNGDYTPTRMEAQHDAAGVICNDRTGSNPENTVGILTMAGKGVDVLVSPTEDAGKVLAAFAGISVGGKSNFSIALQIAQLALKHRKNKHGGQRIVVFVGSPIADSVEQLKKVGKQLKKNNVAVDVVSFGEIAENQEKLDELLLATNSNDNSHVISVPVGTSPVNAVLQSSVVSEGLGALMGGAAGLGGAGAGGAGGANDFSMYGVDADMDPELAMVMRASAEEFRLQQEALQQAERQAQGAAPATDALASSSGVAAAAPSSSAPQGGTAAEGAAFDAGFLELDDDELLRRALEMSMQDTFGAEGGVAPTVLPAAEDMDDDEDEDIRRAMLLSLGGQLPPQDLSDTGDVDESFVADLLNGDKDEQDKGPDSGANDKKRKGDDV